MKKGINWDEQPLGKASDYVIARLLRCSPSTVWKARTKRGIPAFRGGSRPATARSSDRLLARSIMDARPRVRSDVVPINHFALMLFLGDTIASVSEIRIGLGIPLARASELVESAANAGRVVVRRRDPANRRRSEPITIVQLSPRGLREMSRRKQLDGDEPAN